MTFYAMERRNSGAERRERYRDDDTAYAPGQDRRQTERRRTPLHALIWLGQRRTR